MRSTLKTTKLKLKSNGEAMSSTEDKESPEPGQSKRRQEANRDSDLQHLEKELLKVRAERDAARSDLLQRNLQLERLKTEFQRNFRSQLTRYHEQEKLRQSIDAEILEERMRIGRDIHTDLVNGIRNAGSLLQSARAKALEQGACKQESSVELELNTLEKAIADHLERLEKIMLRGREIMIREAPEELKKPGGFEEGLRALIENDPDPVIKKAGKRLKALKGCYESLSQAQEYVYYIIKEALNNIKKHASASKVLLIAERQDGELIFSVIDNGKGIDLEKSGWGRSEMADRADLIGGRLEFLSPPSRDFTQGCEVRLQIEEAKLKSEEIDSGFSY